MGIAPSSDETKYVVPVRWTDLSEAVNQDIVNG